MKYMPPSVKQKEIESGCDMDTNNLKNLAIPDTVLPLQRVSLLAHTCADHTKYQRTYLSTGT